MTDDDPSAGPSTLLHATTVDVDGKGLLIVGPSGSGKSALALQLMALGARLVSDDQTVVSLESAKLVARAPQSIAGRIEARGVGILRADPAPQTHLVAAIDMGQVESRRLPKPRLFQHAFIALPCLNKVDAPYFPAAVLQYLKGGRLNPDEL